MGALKNLMKSKNKISYILFLLQRSIKKNKHRLMVAKLIAWFSPKQVFDKSESRYSFLKDEGSAEYTETLKTEGIVIFPEIIFLEEEISNITSQLDGLTLSDPYSDLKGYDLENMPEDANCHHYHRSDLCNIPEIINLANDQGILQLAKNYLGATPTISNINLWWGTYGDNKPRDNELFHRDKDDYDFVKFFIYLTDTDENDYNIVYVKNSLNSSKALDKLRYNKLEVMEMFGQDNIIHAMGVKGTGFMGANYGVHNGTLPPIKGRKTLLLQIQYSIRGISCEDYQPIDSETILGNVDNSVVPWVNRLIIKKEVEQA